MNGTRLIAAGLLCLPLTLGAATNEIYGRVHMSLDYLDNGTDTSRNISSNSSRVGFRGSQPLQGSLEAVYQVESQFAGDVGEGDWATRDTFLGVQGPLGLVRVGRFGTPLKSLRSNVELFGEQVGDARNIVRGNYTPPGADERLQGFDERFANGVHYRTPMMGSWQVDLHYSTNTGGESYTEDNEDDAVSASVSYRFGNMYLALARENYRRNRSAFRYAGAYDAGSWRFTTFYHQADDPDDRAWGLGTRYKPRLTAYKVQYYQLNADGDGLDASMLAVGLERQLGPAFTLYLSYARLNNDDLQTLTPFEQGRGTSVAEVEPGSNPNAISLGAVYRF